MKIVCINIILFFGLWTNVHRRPNREFIVNCHWFRCSFGFPLQGILQRDFFFFFCFFSPLSCREFLLLLATNITCYHVFRSFTQSDFLKIFSGPVCEFALQNHFTVFFACFHLPSDSKLLCFLIFFVHVAYTEVFLVSDVAFCSWAWLHFCIDDFACLWCYSSLGHFVSFSFWDQWLEIIFLFFSDFKEVIFWFWKPMEHWNNSLVAEEGANMNASASMAAANKTVNSSKYLASSSWVL